MEAFQSLLLGIHIICAVFIVILVLLQPSTGDGSLVSSNMGSAGGIAKGRTVTSFLQKFTLFIAITFMANVLLLGVLSHRKTDKGSQIDQAIDKLMDENNLAVPKGE
ncbi:MAG: preprotein translocase subunit SecG [Rickettsiales bacterium]|jgi:protein translocase SecG subunit|nr:preprotein translocase subunit SecG [Rickettsiales bacterium]